MKDVKIIQFCIDEWHNRYAVLSDGRIFKSRNRGVSGANYDKWIEWKLLEEITKDINPKK